MCLFLHIIYVKKLVYNYVMMLKKQPILVLVLLSLLTGCSPEESRKIIHPEPVGPRIVAFGDSITHGTGEDWGLPNDNWAQFVAEEFNKPILNHLHFLTY